MHPFGVGLFLECNLKSLAMSRLLPWIFRFVDFCFFILCSLSLSFQRERGHATAVSLSLCLAGGVLRTQGETCRCMLALSLLDVKRFRWSPPFLSATQDMEPTANCICCVVFFRLTYTIFRKQGVAPSSRQYGGSYVCI
jgi:hypothetical protein